LRGGVSMNRRALAMVLVLLVLLGSSPLTQGKSAGMQKQSSGCNCHSQTGSTAATVAVTGLPSQYTAGATSTLTITVSNGISGSNGGFSLEADKGSLTAPFSFTVTVNNAQDSATHSSSGTSQRSWSVDWTAPSTGSGIATLSVAGLTANNMNGNSGDRWATASYQISEAGAVPNTAPSVSNVLLGPNGATTTSSPTLSYAYSDSDNDPESGTQIQWYKDDVEQIGLQGLTISASATSKGEEWKATVTPSDGSDSGTPQTSNILTIANSIPSLTTPAIQPTNPTSDDDLTFSSTSSDNDADLVHFDIHWFLNGVLVSELNDMETLPSFATRSGESWTVELRANDTENTSQWQSSSAVVIGAGQTNTAPAASGVVLSPEIIYTTDDFSVNYIFTDIDGDLEVDSEISWFLNNASFSFAENSRTLPSSFTEKGQSWFAKVRVNDGIEWSSWSSSNTLVVENTLPFTESLSLSHTEAKTTDSITVEFTQSDIDGDEESGSEITWWKNDVQEPSLTGQMTLSSESTSKGETWTVMVKAGDGTDVSTIALSANVTIVNSAPTVSVSLSSNVTALGPLNLTMVTEDADGDGVETDIMWYRNGFLEGSLAGEIGVPNQLLGPGQTWAVHVTPTDSDSTSGATAIKTITVLNIEPIAQINVQNEVIWIGEQTTLDATQSSDVDGQIVEATWSWIDIAGTISSDSGLEIQIIPPSNTVVTLTVLDDMGATATVDVQLSAVQGPVITDFNTESKGKSVVLEWDWNGPNATFNVLRNGILVGTTSSKSYTDTPLFAGDTSYAIQPQIGDMTLIAGTSDAQSILIEPAAADVPGPSSTGGLISGIIFLLIGITASGFAFMGRRD
jgi:hypothetical protein